MQKLLFLIPVGLWTVLYWVSQQMTGCRENDAKGICVYWFLTCVAIVALTVASVAYAFVENF